MTRNNLCIILISLGRTKEKTHSLGRTTWVTNILGATNLYAEDAGMAKLVIGIE